MDNLEKDASQPLSKRKVSKIRAAPRRSQFLLGPEHIRLDDWRQIDLGENLKLSAHRDLGVHQANGDKCCLTLLGYMLDWCRPKASNTEILKCLVAQSISLDSCLEATDELGGRWIIIYQSNAESAIFHDAAGLRQIVYARSEENSQLWCASQPDLLSQAAKLKADPAALSFIDAMAVEDPEYWWPGDRLPFAGAKALLPNHRLNLVDGSCQRFWPRSKLQPLSESESCRSICAKLSGSMLAARGRSELALGLSAGWDSRVLLAASRDIVDSMIVYTVQSSQMAADHIDIVIPRKLAKRLGLNHAEILHPDRANDGFLAQFNTHSWRPHHRFAAGAQAEFERFRYSHVAVIGNFSEVAKLPYRNQGPLREPVDGQALAGLIGMGREEFAHIALQEWLSGTRIVAGINVLDLFYWEQRVGRWLAANCIEFDFAWKDIFVPFNIRSLIGDLLACDEEFRAPSAPHLYLEIMNSLWPDVLQEPINPIRKPRFHHRIRRRLLRLFS